MLVSIYLEKPFDVAGLIVWLGPVDFGFNVLQLALRLEIDVDFVGHLGTTTISYEIGWILNCGVNRRRCAMPKSSLYQSSQALKLCISNKHTFLIR